LYKYEISFTIEQGQRRLVSLPRPLRISDINLSERNGELKGVLFLDEENDDKALVEARYKSHCLICALLLMTNMGFNLKEPVIEGKTFVRGKEKVVERVLNISSSVTIELTLGIDNDKRLSEYMYLLDQTPQSRKDSLFRTLRWYDRALLENDITDRFIDLYVVLEILAEYHHPSQSSTRRVKAVIDKLGENRINSEEIVDLRGAILHSGKKEEEARKYLNALFTIVRKGLHEHIGITLP